MDTSFSRNFTLSPSSKSLSPPPSFSSLTLPSSLPTPGVLSYHTQHAMHYSNVRYNTLEMRFPPQLEYHILFPHSDRAWRTDSLLAADLVATISSGLPAMPFPQHFHIFLLVVYSMLLVVQCGPHLENDGDLVFHYQVIHYFLPSFFSLDSVSFLNVFNLLLSSFKFSFSLSRCTWVVLTSDLSSSSLAESILASACNRLASLN